MFLSQTQKYIVKIVVWPSKYVIDTFIPTFQSTSCVVLSFVKVLHMNRALFIFKPSENEVIEKPMSQTSPGRCALLSHIHLLRR